MTAHRLTPHTLVSEDSLRELIGDPTPIVRAKLSDRLNRLTREFVLRAPFVCLATADRDGRCDVSPRGDPPGFVRIPQSDEVVCAGFRVQVLPDGAAFPRFVRVLGADGKKVYEAHGRSYKIDATSSMRSDLSGEFCGDLTGDGVPELVLTESSMGAHCCYTRYVISLSSPPKRLLMWEKGDAGTDIVPVKARPGPSFQLQDRVVMWPPFDGDKGDPVLSYAGAPLVPVIFSFQRGEFQLTSLSFPEVYRKDRNEMRAACVKAPDDCFTQIIEWIDGLAIGDWDSEKLLIQDEELRRSLDRNAAKMRKILAAQLGSEQRPGKTEPNP